MLKGAAWRTPGEGVQARLLSASALAQESQRPQTFRARVDLITADVTVVDGDGRPVRDLGQADFTVRVGGDPRTIVSTQFLEFPPGMVPAPEPTPLYSSNESAGGGRLIAIVVYEGHIRAGGARSALRTTARLLDRLTPADRVAVFSLPGSGQNVPFTNDFARVKTALERLPGRARPITGNRAPNHTGTTLAIPR